MRFEVVSIRPDPEGFTGKPDISGSRLTLQGFPPQWIVGWAFGYPYSHVTGGPAWTGNAYYRVLAKVAESEHLDPADARRRMQTVLEERFHLRHHLEKRLESAYALILAPRGAKLTESAKGTVSSIEPPLHPVNRRYKAANESMKGLASFLKVELGREVVDNTGLTGGYDFELEWVRPATAAPDPSAAPSGPSIFTVLEEKLGLKLEPRKAEVEYLVIDRIEKPSGD